MGFQSRFYELRKNTRCVTIHKAHHPYQFDANFSKSKANLHLRFWVQSPVSRNQAKGSYVYTVSLLQGQEIAESLDSGQGK